MPKASAKPSGCTFSPLANCFSSCATRSNPTPAARPTIVLYKVTMLSLGLGLRVGSSAEKIAHSPVVGDLTALYAHDVDSFKMNPAVSWIDSEELPFMRSRVGFVRYNPIPIAELPVDLCVKIGECLPKVAVQLPHAGLVGRHVWLGRVVDEIVREKLFEDIESSF